MGKQFAWMENPRPPIVPNLAFLIRFIAEFSSCRAESALTAWLSFEDRTQLERMMGRGQTYEQATAELGRRKAAVALRDEMTKREIAVRARDYGATRRLAEAQRLAEQRGVIPPHPNSPLAKRLKAKEVMASAARQTPTEIVAWKSVT